MEVLYYLFEPFMMLFTREFTILGYTISFLQISILGSLLSLAGYAISRIFGGD